MENMLTRWLPINGGTVQYTDRSASRDAPQVAFDMTDCFCRQRAAPNFSHRRSVSQRHPRRALSAFDPRTIMWACQKSSGGSRWTRPAPRRKSSCRRLSDWSTRSASCSMVWALRRKATCRRRAGLFQVIDCAADALPGDPQILVAQRKQLGDGL